MEGGENGLGLGIGLGLGFWDYWHYRVQLICLSHWISKYPVIIPHDNPLAVTGRANGAGPREVASFKGMIADPIMMMMKYR